MQFFPKDASCTRPASRCRSGEGGGCGRRHGRRQAHRCVAGHPNTDSRTVYVGHSRPAVPPIPRHGAANTSVLRASTASVAGPQASNMHPQLRQAPHTSTGRPKQSTRVRPAAAMCAGSRGSCARHAGAQKQTCTFIIASTAATSSGDRMNSSSVWKVLAVGRTSFHSSASRTNASASASRRSRSSLTRAAAADPPPPTRRKRDFSRVRVRVSTGLT